LYRNIGFLKNKVLLLHQLIAEETGGSIGVRDEGQDVPESVIEAFVVKIVVSRAKI